MATLEEFAQQLLRLRGTLRSFYQREIATGRRAIPLEWRRHYNASLGVIENILNDLRNLAPDLGNFSEIMGRVKYRLEKLKVHLNALTASPAGRGLVVDISKIESLADELEKKVASLKQQAAEPKPASQAAQPQQVIPVPSESEILQLFSQFFGELGKLGESLKQAFQTKVEEQKEISEEWLEQVKRLVTESYNILKNIFAAASEALRQFENQNYHAASGAMGRVNANLKELKERWFNLRNLGLNLGKISPAIDLSWSLTGGINRIITRLRQRQQQRQGTVLRKYLILKFILERL